MMTTMAMLRFDQNEQSTLLLIPHATIGFQDEFYFRCIHVALLALAARTYFDNLSGTTEFRIGFTKCAFLGRMYMFPHGPVRALLFG